MLFFINMKFLITATFLILSQLAFAQVNNAIVFDKMIHDFGNVNEESNEVSCVFTFKNISDQPIKILRVETSCGCTTPQYSKEEINPGDSGIIKAVYGTRGRPNSFNKNLYVHFSNSATFQTLVIKGNVIPAVNIAKKPQEYTTNYSNLSFNYSIASFPKITKYQVLNTTIKIYNYNGYPIKFLGVKSMPDYVTLDLQDSLLDVDDSLIVTVTCDGSKVQKIGDNYEQISLLTDDEGSEVKNIYVHTNLRQDFSNLSGKELAKAPVLHIDKTLPLDYGRKTAGARFKDVIVISNKGKSDLNLMKIIPSCSCITYSIAKQSLKPGESVKMFINIDTVNQSIALHNKYLTIISNDPIKPEMSIKMVMDITR